MKRIISLMLSLIIILSLVCVAAPSVSAASAMKTSTMGVNMIKSFEGFAKTPHYDNGQWTVGYGTGVSGAELEKYIDNGITEDEATKLLAEYLGSFEKSVNSFMDTHNLSLSQQQFDALICFTYNLGPSWMNNTGYTLTQAVINGTKGNDFIYAMAQFGKAGGVPVAGLIERRLCEANLYLNGVYSTEPPVNYQYVTYSGNLENVTPSVTIQGYDTTSVSAIKASVSKSGYRFLGWYTKAEGGECVTTLGTKTVGISKLYAHWQNGDGERDDNGAIKGVAAEYSGYAPQGAQKTYKAPNGTEDGSVKADTKLTVVAEYMDASGVKWGKLSTGKWLDISGGLKSTPVFEEPGSAIEPMTVTVTSGGVNNRIGPGTNYAKQGTYTKGQQLVLTAVQKGGNYTWGKSEQGWIALQYTDYETNKLLNSADAKKVTAVGTIIKTDSVNVRAGAGTNHAKVGTYKRNDEVKITLRQKVGNTTWGLTEKGWVSLYYVKVTEVEEGSVPDINVSTGTTGSTGSTGGTITGGTTGNGTSVVSSGMIYNCDTLRIRSGAGTSNAHIGNYTRGTYVNIYETTTVRSEVWGRTDKGWISLRYVKLDAPTTGTGVTGRIVKCTTLNVRSGAGTHYPKVGKLAKGAKVEILEYTKVGNATWGRTNQGWISLYYVALDAPITNLDNVNSGTVGGGTVPPVTEPQESEPQATQYTITVKSAENGRVSAVSSAAKGDTVKLTVTPNSGYELASLTVKDASKNSLNITDNQFTMPASNVEVTATFKAQASKYSVTINTAKNGKVTANTTSCAAGTEVILTVAPNAGYELASLSVMDTATNAAVLVSGNKFTMPAGNVNVVATFQAAAASTYKVTVNAISNGTVIASTTTAKAGDTVTLTVAPNAGYELDELSVKNTITNAAVDVATTGNTCTFTMPASNVTIAASFKTVKYAVKTNASANGTVSANPDQYGKGATVTLDIAPNTGYELDKLTVKDASGHVVATNGNKFTMPASNVEVTATFKLISYDVKFESSANGTITASPATAKKGETVKLTVTPADGYALDKLTAKDASGNAVLVSDNKFTMPASDVTVAATYKKTTFKVTVGTAANGTITADRTTAKIDDIVALTIKPNTGYELDTLIVKDASGNRLTVTDGKFTMPGSDVTVTATFRITKYLVQIPTPLNGSVSVNPDKYTKGETVSLVITPASGYELDKIVVKDAAGKDVALSGNKFVMPASKVTVSATFKLSTYKITAAATTNGKITGAPATAKMGETISLTVTPDTGYELEKLTVKDAAGKEVAVTDNKFVMPASDVSITATFRVPPVNYTIYVDSAIANGAINGAPATAKNGDTITLNVAPASGYKLDKLTVKDANNASVVLSGSGNTRTFTMPASNVTISATFVAVPVTYKVTYTGGDFVNIREAADSTSADLGDIPNGTILEALDGSTEAWIKVKYNNITGWVGIGNLTKVTG